MVLSSSETYSLWLFEELYSQNNPILLKYLLLGVEDKVYILYILKYLLSDLYIVVIYIMLNIYIIYIGYSFISYKSHMYRNQNPIH